MITELNEGWGDLKSKLLEGLPENKRKMVAPLLENQKQMLIETAAEGSTSATAIAGLRKIMIPMIRRVIPNAIATELVGVQPMTGPVGLVYSMRLKYQDSIAAPGSFSDIDGGIGAIDTATDSEAFGNVNLIRRFYSGQIGGDRKSVV